MSEDNKISEENLKWEQQYRIGVLDKLTPLLNCLVLVLEEERKRTLQKIEETKKLINQINTNQ